MTDEERWTKFFIDFIVLFLYSWAVQYLYNYSLPNITTIFKEASYWQIFSVVLSINLIYEVCRGYKVVK